MYQNAQAHTDRLYFDAAATTPVDGRVLAVMEPLFSKMFGNPGSIHAEGVAAKKELAYARKACADALHAHPDEIVFTSGGTESNSLAILGVVEDVLKQHERDYTRVRIVTSAIEHASVLEVCRELEKKGAHVVYVPVDEHGSVVVSEMKKAVTPETTLVSMMFANNEIGMLQPLAEIAKHIRKVRKERAKKSSYPYFHIDAAQAPAWCDVYVEKLGADLVSVDGHKIYGPKGVGLLYVRRGALLSSLFYGGAQERGMRAGTEPVPLIAGLAKALEISEAERGTNVEHMTAVRSYFIDRLQTQVPEAEFNSSAERGLPNLVNVSLPGFDSDFLVISLDERGIACASKSACHSNDDSSYVVAALGKGESVSTSSVRFSMLKDVTKKDVDRVIAALVEIIALSKR